MNTYTTTITSDDMADAFKSARFDAWSGWVDENEWLHTVAESRAHVAGELLLEAGLTAEEARAGVSEFGEVNAMYVLNVVCDYITDNAKTVEVDGDMDEDELEVEAREHADTLLYEALPALIDNAVREQLIPELPDVLAVIEADRED